MCGFRTILTAMDSPYPNPVTYPFTFSKASTSRTTLIPSMKSLRSLLGSGFQYVGTRGHRVAGRPLLLCFAEL